MPEKTPDEDSDESSRLRALWAAVLLVSIKDVVTYMRRNKLNRLPSGIDVPGDAGQSLRWINSPSLRPGGFIWVCSVVDLDPDIVYEFLEKNHD